MREAKLASVFLFFFQRGSEFQRLRRLDAFDGAFILFDSGLIVPGKGKEGEVSGVLFSLNADFHPFTPQKEV